MNKKKENCTEYNIAWAPDRLVIQDCPMIVKMMTEGKKRPENSQKSRID